MIFEQWAPAYRQILSDFNFSEEADAESAAYLSEICRKSGSQKERDAAFLNLKSRIAGKTAVICANAPTLEKDLLCYLNEEQNQNVVWAAADGAAVILLNHHIVPGIIVTDLDGKNPSDAETEIKAADEGALLVVHAHGDNRRLLEKYVPRIEKKHPGRFIPTCQCRPPVGIYNFGGFTDGDRCVFLAEEMGAAEIILLGFDYNDPDVTDLKKKKLKWAEQLILQMSRNNPGKIKYLKRK